MLVDVLTINPQIPWQSSFQQIKPHFPFLECGLDLKSLKGTDFPYGYFLSSDHLLCRKSAATEQEMKVDYQKTAKDCNLQPTAINGFSSCSQVFKGIQKRNTPPTQTQLPKSCPDFWLTQAIK